jgi:hypothetical protein
VYEVADDLFYLRRLEHPLDNVFWNFCHSQYIEKQKRACVCALPAATCIPPHPIPLYI